MAERNVIDGLEDSDVPMTYLVIMSWNDKLDTYAWFLMQYFPVMIVEGSMSEQKGYIVFAAANTTKQMMQDAIKKDDNLQSIKDDGMYITEDRDDMYEFLADLTMLSLHEKLRSEN